jgi:hypothetical protein
MRASTLEVITDDAPAIDSRRELARRASGGIEVALYWNPDDGTTSIEIWQADSELTLHFGVRRSQALEAFYHPFAHLA